MLHLTALLSTLSSSGEEKVKKIQDGNTSKIDYYSLGIKPPKDEDIDLDEDGNLILKEGDLDFKEVPVTIPLSNLDSWIANINGGSTVYTKNGLEYNVVEEHWEIDSFIEYITMSWIEKKYLYLKSVFQSFFQTNKK